MNYYVKNTGNDTNDGSSWANAFRTLLKAIITVSPGDTIYVDSIYSHTDTNETFYAIRATYDPANNNLVKIICQNSSTNLLASTAEQIITVNFGLEYLLQNGYTYGMIFNIATTRDWGYFEVCTPGNYIFEKCTFNFSINKQNGILVGCNNDFFDATFVKLINCDFIFSGNNNAMIQQCLGKITMEGGTLSGSNPDYLVANYWDGGSFGWNFFGEILFNSVDLTGVTPNIALVLADYFGGIVRFKNCQLPLDVPIISGNISDKASKVIVENSDRNELYCFGGTLLTETTLIKSGGATNGTTQFSWKIATSAVIDPFLPFEVPQLMFWNDITGTPKTIEIDFLHDSITDLTNADIFMKINGVSNGLETVLSSPTTLDTSPASWTTTGMTNPNKQKLSVTFTPTEKGLVVVELYIGKPSCTIYIDPVVK